MLFGYAASLTHCADAGLTIAKNSNPAKQEFSFRITLPQLVFCKCISSISGSESERLQRTELRSFVRHGDGDDADLLVVREGELRGAFREVERVGEKIRILIRLLCAAGGVGRGSKKEKNLARLGVRGGGGGGANRTTPAARA